MKSHRRRLREISWDKLEDIKEGMGFDWDEIATFLGISRVQLSRYKSCYRLPADRYYAFKDALLIETEARHRAEREAIIKLFS